MKRLTIIVSFVVFAALFANAQSFKGGVQAGISASQIDGDKMSGYRKFSPYGGLFVQHPLGTGKWSAQMELNYTGRGACDKQGDVRTAMGYAEIPLLISCNIMDLPLKLQAGVAAAYKIFENTETMGIKHKSTDYGTWDFPVIVNINCNITERIAADVRFTYSMLSVGRRFYNNALSFGLRYYIVK